MAASEDMTVMRLLGASRKAYRFSQYICVEPGIIVPQLRICTHDCIAQKAPRACRPMAEAPRGLMAITLEYGMVLVLTLVISR